MKKLILLVLGLQIAIVGSAHADAFTEIEKGVKKLIPGMDSEQKNIFANDVESKQQQMLALTKEKSALAADENRQVLKNVQADLEEIRNKIMVITDQLRKDSENELLKKQLDNYTEMYHLHKEYQQLWDSRDAAIDQSIKQITDYLSDPDFAKYKQAIIDGKKSFTFDDLQAVHQRILEADKRVDSLSDQEKNAMTEMENRSRAATANIESYAKKKAEIDLARKENRHDVLADELWSLQENLFANKKKVDELKLKEIEYKIELLKLKLFIAKGQRNVIRDLFKEMKTSVQVSEADVAFVKDEFEKKKQKNYRDKNGFDNVVERLDADLKIQRYDLEVLSKRYNIPLDVNLDQWNKEPKHSVSAYTGYCEVGMQNDAVLLIERHRDYSKAQIDLINEKIRHDEILIAIKETFHKIRYEKLKAAELTQELKKYDMIKAGIRANISSNNERKAAASDLFEIQKKALENLDQFRAHVRDSRDLLFKEQAKEYNHCLMLLNDAREKIKNQQKIITDTIGIYSSIISSLNATNKQIDFIVSELGSITIWHRPQYAISWEGLTSIVPDVQHYIADLSYYFTHFDFSTLIGRIKNLFRYPLTLIMAIIKFLFIIGMLWGAKYILPTAMHKSQLYGQLHPWLYAPLMLFVGVGRFFLLNFNTLSLWAIIGLSFKLQILTDPFLFSLFYLCSIAYLLYMASSLIAYLTQFNRDHNYLFISREFEFRFVLVISGLVYATILLYFFRKAFMLGNYTRSELPSILLAINFIIIQVSLIALIAKEQVLSLIPRMGIGEWIYHKIDRYYYVILATIILIIVMSNPYVGFGRLVWYVIRQIILTGILITALIWLHAMLKRFCSYFFFVSEENEASHERFINAKTWYGFTIIVLFVLFVFFGILFTAKIWGWPEQLAHISHIRDIIDWLKQPFSHVDQKPVSVWLFLQLIAFILAALGVSFIFNNFVISKIFDILLIEPGVQNTVGSITYYVFFALAVIIGFSAVGLTSLLVYLLAVVVGIGWIIKDPVSDFVSYFIILVQRPVKVGDLVRLDEDGPAVVRKVTPRSVILRRRNSTTIIIPNSVVINKVITNWNYQRDYIAFDDILVTISYKSDANLAQKILLSVLADHPSILKAPKPVVRLDNFTENGYLFMVRGFLSSNYTLDQWEIASDVRLHIIKRLKESGVEIAVPVREVISRRNEERLY